MDNWPLCSRSGVNVPSFRAVRRGIRQLATALTMTAVVAACSDEPGAGTLPTASPTTTTTPSPTPISTATTVTDEAAVRRAVRRYIASLNEALRTPERADELVAPLIASACTCRQVVATLRDLAQDGYYLDYRYTVSDIRVQQVGAVGASATYVARQSAGHKRDHTGKSLQAFNSTTVRYSVHFQRQGTRWLLDRSDVMK